VGDLVFLKLGQRRGMRRGTSVHTWYERGCALEGTDSSAAMAAYRRALAGQPELADAHCNLGRLHHDRGELADAEACYRLAACCEPGVALYWFNLGVALDDQGRRAEAIGAYQRAIALHGGLADAHYNLARLYEQVGRAADDEVMLCRAVRHLARYRDILRAG
jgi:tetratricopeptide (TPR) repeat protein